jgi:hypothetical protein
MDTPVDELPGVGEAGAFGHPTGAELALTAAGAVTCSDRADTREKTRITAISRRHRKLVLFLIDCSPFLYLYSAASLNAEYGK